MGIKQLSYIVQKKTCIPFRDSDMIYKSERSNTASNDPRLPVVDAVEENTNVMLNDDDDDDDDEAVETSDEDYDVPLIASSNIKPPKTERTRKTPSAKVSWFIFEPKKCLSSVYYALAKNSCTMQRMPRAV